MIDNPFEQEMARFEEMKKYFSCNFETGMIQKIKLFTNHRQFKIGEIIKSKNIEGYIRITFKGNYVLAHRFIFYCYHNTLYPLIDHENTIKDDNRILNLRGATNQQNQHNRINPQSNNKSGFLGVCLNKPSKKYSATICINKKNKHLGLFVTPEEAHQAYLTAKRELHEFCTI